MANTDASKFLEGSPAEKISSGNSYAKNGI
jgi:hypothetical protein